MGVVVLLAGGGLRCFVLGEGAVRFGGSGVDG